MSRSCSTKPSDRRSVAAVDAPRGTFSISSDDSRSLSWYTIAVHAPDHLRRHRHFAALRSAVFPERRRRTVSRLQITIFHIAISHITAAHFLLGTCHPHRLRILGLLGADGRCIR